MLSRERKHLVSGTPLHDPRLGVADTTPSQPWTTHERTCTGCGQHFTCTAAEQRFWYEVLHLPSRVRIRLCPPCRRRRRAARGISSRLSALLPGVSSGEASIVQQRETVVVIADGVLRPAGRTRDHHLPVITGIRVVERALAVISQLRTRGQVHDDLLPIAIRLHEQLAHPRTVRRLRQELDVLMEGSGSLRRRARLVEAYLAQPTHRRRLAVINA